MRRLPLRLGFTALELLTVVAIIVTLLALLFPALHSSQEQAKQVMCRNNLKQIGLALHNYHDAHKVFPPGITSWGPKAKYVAKSDECDDPQWSRVTAYTLILPFMEERALYQGYNFKLASCNKANATSLAGVVKTYICPNNPRGDQKIKGGGYVSFDMAPTDYLMCLGANALAAPVSPFTLRQPGEPSGYPNGYRPGAGVFNVNSNVSVRTIRDGTSYTFMIGEGAGGVAHGNPEIGADPVTEAHADATVDQGWGQAYLGTTGGKGGYGSVFAATAYDAWYNASYRLATPNNSIKPWKQLPVQTGALKMIRGTTFPKSYSEGITAKGEGDAPPDMLPVSMSPFRSYHEDMCHFLFCDGSVRPITGKINAKTYIGMSSAQGREIFELDGAPRAQPPIRATPPKRVRKTLEKFQAQ